MASFWPVYVSAAFQGNERIWCDWALLKGTRLHHWQWDRDEVTIMFEYWTGLEYAANLTRVSLSAWVSLTWGQAEWYVRRKKSAFFFYTWSTMGSVVCVCVYVCVEVYTSCNLMLQFCCRVISNMIQLFYIQHSLAVVTSEEISPANIPFILQVIPFWIVH